MTDQPSAVGVVLAGGYSTRFGERDKALAPVEGTPMVRRVVDRVGQVTDAVVVNCRTDQRDGFADVLVDCDAPVAFAIDAVPDEGPLVGLAGALSVYDAPVTVLVACDMPFVDREFLAFLYDTVVSRETEAAVPSATEGIQPAQAILVTDAARRAAGDAIAAGEASLRAMYDRLDPVVVDRETIEERGFAPSLLDVNTRHAMARQDGRLRE